MPWAGSITYQFYDAKGFSYKIMNNIYQPVYQWFISE